MNDYGNIITTEYAGASTSSATFVYEIEVKRVSRTPFKNLISREQNGTLQFLNTAEGYAEPVSTGSTAFKYVYQYKDHTSARLSAGLGNIRLSYKDISTTSTPVLQILEENNYYPFVLKHKGYNNAQNGRDHKYGFGNKEEQNELGLGWIDITARNYDAALGRWMNVDPLAFQYSNITPYAFVANMPIISIDPDGKRIVIIGNEDYINQIKFQLAKLATTEEGSRQILALAGSKDDFIISDFNQKKDVGNMFLGGETREKDGGSGNRNFFINIETSTFNKPLSDGTERTGATSLSHELSHTKDAVNGTSDDRRATTKDAFNKRQAISADEIPVTHRENLVRQALGIELRKSNGIVPVMNMQLGGRKEELDWMFELVRKPEGMYFDYSSVPKASQVFKLQTQNGVKPYKEQTNLSEWTAKRRGFSKFQTNYNQSDKAVILEGNH